MTIRLDARYFHIYKHSGIHYSSNGISLHTLNETLKFLLCWSFRAILLVKGGGTVTIMSIYSASQLLYSYRYSLFQIVHNARTI